MVHYEDNRTELFNLADDPGETTDLAGQNTAKVAELKKILETKLAESNAKFPIENPDYIPRD